MLPCDVLGYQNFFRLLISLQFCLSAMRSAINGTFSWTNCLTSFVMSLFSWIMLSKVMLCWADPVCTGNALPFQFSTWSTISDTYCRWDNNAHLPVWTPGNSVAEALSTASWLEHNCIPFVKAFMNHFFLIAMYEMDLEQSVWQEWQYDTYLQCCSGSPFHCETCHNQQIQNLVHCCGLVSTD